MQISNNPYSPPVARDERSGDARPNVNAVYFVQIAACSFAGFAVAVFYIEEFVVAQTLRILQHLCVGTGFWIGWGVIVVSSFVTHLVLRSSAQTKRWYPRFTAVPIGFCVALMAKYLLDGRL